MTSLSDFPDHALKRIPASQRPGVMTSDEAINAFISKSEGDLQKEMGKLLDLRKIAYMRQRMDKKTTGTVGWPDFTACISGIPLAFEVKHESRKLDPDQKRVITDMLANGWRVFVIRRLSEFRDLLNAYQSGTATTQTNIDPSELQ